MAVATTVYPRDRIVLTSAIVTASARTVFYSTGERGPGDAFVVVGGQEVPMVLKAVIGGSLTDVTWAFA